MKKYKYRLFGMGGTPYEYHTHSDDKEGLLQLAAVRIKQGQNAYIEDCVTGVVAQLTVKKRAKK